MRGRKKYMAVIYTRKATIDDLDKIMSIVEDARALFKNDKIPQWQGGYPDEERFKEDINNEEAYVLVVGDESSRYRSINY